MNTKHQVKVTPTAAIPGINVIKPNHDREALKAKHIKSPDVSMMPFHIHDPKMRTTVYFTSQARKDKYIERLENPQAESPLKKGGKSLKNRNEKNHSDRD